MRISKIMVGNVWRDCIGIVDGTLVAFKGQPLGKEESAEYYNFRKAKYGLQVTFIVDNRRQILVSYLACIVTSPYLHNHVLISGLYAALSFAIPWGSS